MQLLHTDSSQDQPVLSDSPLQESFPPVFRYHRYFHYFRCCFRYSQRFRCFHYCFRCHQCFRYRFRCFHYCFHCYQRFRCCFHYFHHFRCFQSWRSYCRSCDFRSQNHCRKIHHFLRSFSWMLLSSDHRSVHHTPFRSHLPMRHQHLPYTRPESSHHVPSHRNLRSDNTSVR